MRIIINTLSKEQMNRILEYFDYYHPNEELKKIHLLRSDVSTEHGRNVYRNAKFNIDHEAWEKKGSELNDIFYQGNYTIEDRLTQVTK